jgi:hypothetical protein
MMVLSLIRVEVVVVVVVEVVVVVVVVVEVVVVMTPPMVSIPRDRRRGVVTSRRSRCLAAC